MTVYLGVEAWGRSDMRCLAEPYGGVCVTTSNRIGGNTERKYTLKKTAQAVFYYLKGDGDMSAVAKNYVYEIRVTDDKKPEPTISKARLEECLRNVAPYLVKGNAKKN